MTDTTAPNHHAHYPAFAGASGLFAALSMAHGRDGDAELVSRLSGLASGDRVIDIGCGPGGAARYAAKRGATVSGIDPASVMLRVARLLTRSSKVRFVEAGAESLPVPDDDATIVWTIASVHHWRDIEGALGEIRRVLRSGGRFVAVERHSTPGAQGLGSHGWTDAQADAFADICRAQGFVEVRVEQNADGRRATISMIATAP